MTQTICSHPGGDGSRSREEMGVIGGISSWGDIPMELSFGLQQDAYFGGELADRVKSLKAKARRRKGTYSWTISEPCPSEG